MKSSAERFADLERELLDLANSPLDQREMDMLELQAMRVLVDRMVDDIPHARQVLRLTAEIRKARGTWDAKDLSTREIDEEIAHLRRLA